MKKLLEVCTFWLSCFYIHAQNVGIGTVTPQKRLSVNGTIVVDHDSNNFGTLDSASLLFGAQPALTGITSNKNLMGINPNGLDLWTNGEKRLTISESGYISIGVDNPLYKLHVAGSLFASSSISTGSNAYVSSSLKVDSTVGIGGAWNNSYRLFVQGGNSQFEGDGTFTGLLSGESIRSGSFIRADDRISIAGNVDNMYRLRVYNGNSSFGGNVQVTGDLNTANASESDSLTINGNGSVRSNGPSPLRSGFDQGELTC